jgi:hypothetical protein
MRRLDTAYGIFRKTVFAACTGLPVSEWKAAVAAALEDLETQGYLHSWQIQRVSRRLKGVVVRITPHDLPPVQISILPESGKAATLPSPLI